VPPELTARLKAIWSRIDAAPSHVEPQLRPREAGIVAEVGGIDVAGLVAAGIAEAGHNELAVAAAAPGPAQRRGAIPEPLRPVAADRQPPASGCPRMAFAAGRKCRKRCGGPPLAAERGIDLCLAFFAMRLDEAGLDRPFALRGAGTQKQFSAPCHASSRPWSRRSSANLRVAGEK
jgi:hypothetical protein